MHENYKRNIIGQDLGDTKFMEWMKTPNLGTPSKIEGDFRTFLKGTVIIKNLKRFERAKETLLKDINLGTCIIIKPPSKAHAELNLLQAIVEKKIKTRVMEISKLQCLIYYLIFTVMRGYLSDEGINYVIEISGCHGIKN